MEEKVLLGVYDNLRREGDAFNSYLYGAKYIGTYYTEPIYDMYALNVSYPGLRPNGSTSILLEIFELDLSDLKVTDYYEGYSEYNPYQNIFNRIEIDTPFGECFIYEYSKPIVGKPLIDTGDWFRYKQIVKENVFNINNREAPRWGVE